VAEGDIMTTTRRGEMRTVVAQRAFQVTVTCKGKKDILLFDLGGIFDVLFLNTGTMFKLFKNR